MRRSRVAKDGRSARPGDAPPADGASRRAAFGFGLQALKVLRDGLRHELCVAAAVLFGEPVEEPRAFRQRDDGAAGGRGDRIMARRRLDGADRRAAVAGRQDRDVGFGLPLDLHEERGLGHAPVGQAAKPARAVDGGGGVAAQAPAVFQSLK